jgi:hypothetical protein
MDTDLFTKTVQRMENGEDISDVLFCFEGDDQYYIERVIKAVKALLKHRDISANQTSSISKLLLGLQKMPLITPGLYVRMELSEKLNGDATTYSISIGEDEFRTDSGGFVSGPMGSDSFSGPTFEVGKRFRNCDVWMIYDLDWPEVFAEMSQHSKLTIEDHSDNGSLDWEHPDGSIFWEWIEANPQE